MNPFARAVFWIKASRIEFITASVVPVVVGGAVAWHETHSLMWGWWVITLFSMGLLHSAANLANDYYDHLSGNDAANTEYIRPFTGGSRLIQNAATSARSIFAASLICLMTGAALGMSLVWLRGWPILAVGVIGGLSGFFYTANPLRLGYRGVGEIAIFLDFGLLPVIGTAYVQTGQALPAAAAASIPVGLLIAAILWINQFPDYHADRAVNKLHWVVRLGRRRAAWVYSGMMSVAALSVPAFVIAGLLPLWALLALLPAPMTARAILTALRFHDDPPRLLPANVATIQVHLLTGLLLAIGLVLG